MDELTQIAQIAIATGHTVTPACPRCDRYAGFEIPRNGIGLVCVACGAWSILRVPKPEATEPPEEPTMNADSVQFLSNIARTQWVSGPDGEPVVNDMLSQGWALLAAGVNPYGDPTWLLGLSYDRVADEEGT